MNSAAEKLIRDVCRVRREPDRPAEETAALYTCHAIEHKLPSITLFDPFIDGPSRSIRETVYNEVMGVLDRARIGNLHTPEVRFVDLDGHLTPEPRDT